MPNYKQKYTMEKINGGSWAPFFVRLFFVLISLRQLVGGRKRVEQNMAKRTNRKKGEKRKRKKKNAKHTRMTFTFLIEACKLPLFDSLFLLPTRIQIAMVNECNKKTNHLLLFVDKVLKTRRKKNRKK